MHDYNLSLYIYRGDNGHEGHQPTLVQQLKVELSHKNMIFSKRSIHLSKVVGQGMQLINIRYYITLCSSIYTLTVAYASQESQEWCIVDILRVEVVEIW